MVLALGRTNPLKNLPLTLDAWRALPAPRPELCLFGIEPELARRGGHALRRVPLATSSVNELFNQATRVHPDLHPRGLRAAAAGVDGDRRGGGVHRRPRQPRLLRGRRQLPDARARRRARCRTRCGGCSRTRSCAGASGAAGIETAQDYAWERRIDALERFLEAVARGRRPMNRRCDRRLGVAPQPREGRLRLGAALPRLCQRALLHAVRGRARRARGARGAAALPVCTREFAVHRGVPDLLYEPPEHILVEAAGLERFAEVMVASGWNRETVLRAPERRARLLVRAGALDAPAAHDGALPRRAERSWTSARTPAGPPTTSPSAGCRRSPSTSPRPSCRGSTRPTTSSRRDVCSSSACSARWTRSRSPRAAWTTSTAARSCTTTTPPGCGGPSPRSSASCAPAGAC